MPPNQNNGQPPLQAATTANQQGPQNVPPPQLPTNPSLPPIPTPQVITQPDIPPPPQQTNPPPAPPSSLYPKSTKKIFLVIIFGFFVLSATTLGGALALAYNNYPVINPPKPIKQALDNILAISPLPKPTRLVIDSTFAKTSALKSADLKTTLSVTADSENSPVESLQLTIEGPAEFDNPSSKASEFDISGQVEMEGASFSGAASVKTVEDRIYFKLNEVPFGQIYRELLDYKGKWYFWDIPAEYKQEDTDKEISENIKKIITDFVQESQAWTTIVSTEGEVYEMEINPPKEELANLIYDIVQSYEPKDQEKLIADLEKEKIKEQIDKVNDLKIKMKINKDTYYLKDISVQFNMVLDDFYPRSSSESLSPQGKMTLNFNLTAELSNYNRSVTIVPPADAINVEEAFKNLDEVIPLSPEQEKYMNDAKTKNDIGAIATELQAYYTSPGVGSYPADLSKLVEEKLLQELPTPPLETGVLSYTYTKSPENCDGTAASKCEEVTLSAPLLEPKEPGNVWCWQSTTNIAEELPPGQCSVSNQDPLPESEGGFDEEDLHSLIAPEESILGEKYNWEQELLKIFTRIIN